MIHKNGFNIPAQLAGDTSSTVCVLDNATSKTQALSVYEVYISPFGETTPRIGEARENQSTATFCKKDISTDSRLDN